jgi:hypothetical protein
MFRYTLFFVVCSAFAVAFQQAPVQWRAISTLSRRSTCLAAFEFEYTHTEVNGMIWKLPQADLSLVIDPIASQLDFGLPWGYRANRVYTGEEETLDMIQSADPSYCLISQGLDDHCHLKTLTELQQRVPSMKFIVAPSAEKKLSTIVDDTTKIIVLKPGESMELPSSASDEECILTAVEGSLVGPPWADRENGWLVSIHSKQNGVKSVFYEPHADIKDETLESFNADVVIAPVKKQFLPVLTLVYGYERTPTIMEKLNAKVLIPLRNGELKTEGPLSMLVQSSGPAEGCKSLFNSEIRIEESTPGVPLTVTLG